MTSTRYDRHARHPKVARGGLSVLLALLVISVVTTVFVVIDHMVSQWHTTPVIIIVALGAGLLASVVPVALLVLWAWWWDLL